MFVWPLGLIAPFLDSRHRLQFFHASQINVQNWIYHLWVVGREVQTLYRLAGQFKKCLRTIFIGLLSIRRIDQYLLSRNQCLHRPFLQQLLHSYIFLNLNRLLMGRLDQAHHFLVFSTQRLIHQPDRPRSL